MPRQGGWALNFIEELKRRKVIRVAVVYAITAWLLVQIAAVLFPMFGVPEWASRFVVILLMIGFPIALILAWALEVMPDGIRTTSQDAAPASVGRSVLRSRPYA